MAKKELLFFIVLALFSFRANATAEKSEECSAKGQNNGKCLIDNIVSESSTLTAKQKNIEPGLLVFISSSMHKENIKQLMNEACDRNITLVLRGLIDNSFKKTMQYIQQFYGEKGEVKANIIIDPTLYKEFNVTSVPSFVLIGQENKHDKLIGNVTVQYALEILSKEGDLEAEAKKLLRQRCTE